MYLTKKVVAALIITAAFTSCKKEETDSQNRLNGNYHAVFKEGKDLSSQETITFHDNGNFSESYKYASKEEHRNGTYSYDAGTHKGILHYSDKHTENFTCYNGELHVANHQYCTKHEGGHHNNHSHGNHNGGHGGGHDGGHGDTHHK